MKQILARVPDELRDMIKKAADLDGVSINTWLIKVLKEGCRASARAAVAEAKRADLREWQKEQMGKAL